MTRGISNSDTLHLLKREFLNEFDYKRAYEQEATNRQLVTLGEIYQILRDGRVVGQFSEGQLDRHGNPMHYAEFIREFESFVLAWESRIDTNRLGYRIIGVSKKL